MTNKQLLAIWDEAVFAWRDTGHEGRGFRYACLWWEHVDGKYGSPNEVAYGY